MTPIRIRVLASGSGLLIADSPDLPGLHAMERSEEELISSLCELIPLLYAERGITATVTAIQKLQDDQPAAWVVAAIRDTTAAKVD